VAMCLRGVFYVLANPPKCLRLTRVSCPPAFPRGFLNLPLLPTPASAGPTHCHLSLCFHQ